jgi:hypothetical protein
MAWSSAAAAAAQPHAPHRLEALSLLQQRCNLTPLQRQCELAVSLLLLKLPRCLFLLLQPQELAHHRLVFLLRIQDHVDGDPHNPSHCTSDAAHARWVQAHLQL